MISSLIDLIASSVVPNVILRLSLDGAVGSTKVPPVKYTLNASS